MKLSTVVVAAAALTGAALMSSNAMASATVFEVYNYSPGDGTYLFVTNTGSTPFTDVTITGGYSAGNTDFGALAVGASTGEYYLGDNEDPTPGSDGTATVTVTYGGHSYSQNFTDIYGDLDIQTTPVELGDFVPEPASWALMLLGFVGLGGVLRSSRRRAVAA